MASSTYCYYCKEFKNIEVPLPDILNPFCNKEEHEAWAKKHYGSPKRGGQRTIKDIQERLIKMGKQAPVTSNGQLFDEEEEAGVNLDH